MLQECRANPTLPFDAGVGPRLRFPVMLERRSTMAWLTHDTGIILRDGDQWRIEHQDLTDDSKGMLVVAVWREKLRVAIVNIHGPNEADRKWWQMLYQRFGSYLIDPKDGIEFLVLMGGDWNLCFWDDDEGKGVARPMLSWRAGSDWGPHTFFNTFGLVDAVRLRQPTGHLWTRANQRKGEWSGTRRLDVIRCSRAWANYLTHDFKAFHLGSDHLATKLSLQLPQAAGGGVKEDNQRRGAGFWHLHPGVWPTGELQRSIRRHANQLALCGHYADAEDAIERWTRLRRDLRVFVFNQSIRISREVAGLPVELARLEGEIAQLNMRDASQRPRLGPLLDQVEWAMATLEQHRRLARGYDIQPGLQDESWMALLPGGPQEGAGLRLSSKDDVQTGIKEQCDLIHCYRDKLHTPDTVESGLRECSTRLLLKHWSPQCKTQNFRRPTTAKELSTALACGDDASAPGVDGLTYRVYKEAPDLLDALADTVNKLSQSGGALPADQGGVRMRLNPKKGDLTLVSNWRGIGVPTAERRIYGRAQSTRLTEVEGLIHEHQFAYLPGRSATHSVALLSAAIDAVRFLDAQPFMLLSVDLEKAFDRISHSWILTCLKHALGEQSNECINLLESIFASTTLHFNLDGHPVKPVRPKAGVVQGAPESGILFNIALEPYLAALRSEGMTVLAYADDVMVMVHTPEQLELFKYWTMRFEEASNSRVNSDKSKAYWVDVPEARKKAHKTGKFGQFGRCREFVPYPLDPIDGFIHLGCPINLDHGITMDVWSPYTDRLQSKTSCFDPLECLLGKVGFLNQTVLSKLWHALSCTPSRTHEEKRIWRVLKAFLFPFGDYIRGDWVNTPRAFGGWGLIPPLEMNMALVAGNLKYLLTQPSFRTHLHRLCLKEIGSHAILFFKQGESWQKVINVNFAQKSFSHFVLYTLAHLGVEIDLDDIEDWTIDELLALPSITPGFGTLQMPKGDADRSRLVLSGLWTQADITWTYDGQGRDRHDRRQILPHHHLRLMPPHPWSIKYNWVPFDHRPDKTRATRGCQAFSKQDIAEHWASLSPTVRARFLTLLDRPKHPNEYEKYNRPQRAPHIRPIRWQPSEFVLRFDRIRIAGVKLRDYTVATGREWLARHYHRRPYAIPDWSFNEKAWRGAEEVYEANEPYWRPRWSGLMGLPLDAAGESDLRRFLLHRVRLSREPKSLPEDLARLHQKKMSLNERANNPEAADDYREARALEDEVMNNVFRVTNCPHCPQDTPDSPEHGYVTCPRVQALWTAAMEPLKRLHDYGHAPPPLTVRDVVLGWPDLKLSAVERKRLWFWEAIVIAELARHRNKSIQAAFHRRDVPKFDYVDDVAGFVNGVTREMFRLLRVKFRRLQKDSRSYKTFCNTFVGGTERSPANFVHVVEDGRLELC